MPGNVRLIGQNMVYPILRKQRQEEYTMGIFYWISKRVGAAISGDKLTGDLRKAGLDEKALRRMAPDDRVATLERAGLDPYDYIYLAY